MKHTKIICTIGPSCSDYETLKQMVSAGMNVTRINMSHGDHEEQQNKINTIKKLRKDLKMPLAIMIDTKGPEIRIKTFKEGKIQLKAGQKFTFTTDDIIGDQNIVSVTYVNLHKDIKVGDTILLNDGMLTFKVLEVVGTQIHCICENDGELSDKKGMHFPNTPLSMEFLTEHDKKDLLFAVKNDTDYIACSFVSNKQNVLDIKNFLAQNGMDDCRIIAKIENQTGVDNIDEILEVADGIMVARGDMGVEIDYCLLPQIQKNLIKKAKRNGKEVIVATEMLESMIKNPRPTRAEISDVANAVYDEASAVMLSGETANGKNPVKAVQIMANICTAVEKAIKYEKRFKNREINETSVTDLIAHSACNTAMILNAKAIIVSTESGKTARVVSKFRPNVPILTFVLNEKTFHQLSLVWGVYAIIDTKTTEISDLINKAQNEMKKILNSKPGDLFIVTAGLPLGEKGNTNLIQVEKVKE